MKLSLMSVSPASPKETERNLNNAKRLGFPRIGKAETPKLAIVGGGPSILEKVEELKAFDGDIWAINGAFQWCKDHGIDAWFFSVDPSEKVASFVKGARRAFVAMDSHPAVFKALSSAKVEAVDLHGLAHGPTTSTSAPVLGLMRGYKEFHFYGCEGSFPANETVGTHAYGNFGLDTLLRVTCHGEQFYTTADMMVQVEYLGELMAKAPTQLIDKSGGLLAAYVKDPNIDVTDVCPALYDAVVKSHREKAEREEALKDKGELRPITKPSGVLIALPAGGQMVTAKTTECLYATCQFLTAQKIPNRLMMFSAADIEDIRNLFVTQWYDAEPDYSHLLFIDADMGWPPALIRDMLQFDRPLQGVLYARRQMPASVVGTAPEGHGMKDVHNGFMQATGLGCGVMMIQREVIRRMIEKFPELIDETDSYLLRASEGKLKRMLRVFDKIRTQELRLSEDMSFCQRWRECGGDIWANVAHTISHVGPFDYHMRYQGIMESKEAELEAAA